MKFIDGFLIKPSIKTVIAFSIIFKEKTYHQMKKILFFFLLLNFSVPVFADSMMELGLDVFNNKGECGVCHTLQAAGSTGNIGPNLDQLKPLMPQVIANVTNGIGVMPAFEGILTSEEIKAVSYFVFTSTNQ